MNVNYLLLPAEWSCFTQTLIHSSVYVKYLLHGAHPTGCSWDGAGGPSWALVTSTYSRHTHKKTMNIFLTYVESSRATRKMACDYFRGNRWRTIRMCGWSSDVPANMAGGICELNRHVVKDLGASEWTEAGRRRPMIRGRFHYSTQCCMC